MQLSFLAAVLLFGISADAFPAKHASPEPFLTQLDGSSWTLGNNVWNLTQESTYGVKLMYKGRDCVGDAAGHYVSYNGAASNLNWTSASITKRGTYRGKKFIDIAFTAVEGDMHWVVFAGMSGAYQYFVNRALPVLGEFRTLWRLDNVTFTRGRTDIKDEELPPLKDYIPQNKVQDETWLRPDGSGYITKYDFTAWSRNQDFFGVYGEGFGSWYINPGKDYYNGDHLKQELMVHRESATGDVVQLNMIHGTHFMASSKDLLPEGKIWGPWLWYLNDGDKEDVAQRAAEEFQSWPYKWLVDEEYHSRGIVTGRLTLSDGRPASNAAVFLGDPDPTKTTLDMGTDYYYTTYADKSGRFEIPNVRAGTYGLQAWSNGSSIADVSTTFLVNKVTVKKSKRTNLGHLTWKLSPKEKLFQIGEFDRYSYGFSHGGAPYQHGLVAACPADLTYTVGESQTSDWCFGQTYRGNWTVRFRTSGIRESAAPELIVSLAGYASGASSNIFANGVQLGNMTSGSAWLPSDPSLYRSATAAGEWHLLRFPFDKSLLKDGWNDLTFNMVRNTTWHGFMWDSVALEC
ncbi:Rhamnogalacturonan endolyase [Penicillium ucsense]|uniref:rhamnogalacturonan endolyase n=1 Tax=Penicillium ucsense TaxID=2839758 RepID=A0A8J8VZI6_9EURO|nr:Rhamnogalacturonan endolyase [Penicillium ucsense]KAF7734287.1 Rhamnogalacturonan endolyase [Penicillium ucsense]